MIIDGHTLPCYFADGFCKPTTKTPFTLVWFSDDFCLIFSLQDFIGRMTKIDNRYWIETDCFVHSATPKNLPPLMESRVLLIVISVLLILKLHITQVFLVLKSFLMHIPFVENLNFCILLNILTFFVTYTEGFNMHTGQPNPISIIIEYISGKIVLNNSNNKYIFPALNVSNNFATIDYEAHINIKIDYSINHVFRSMTVQELNTLHTVCESERIQLRTILAKSSTCWLPFNRKSQ